MFVVGGADQFFEFLAKKYEDAGQHHVQLELLSPTLFAAAGSPSCLPAAAPPAEELADEESVVEAEVASEEEMVVETACEENESNENDENALVEDVERGKKQKERGGSKRGNYWLTEDKTLPQVEKIIKGWNFKFEKGMDCWDLSFVRAKKTVAGARGCWGLVCSVCQAHPPIQKPSPWWTSGVLTRKRQKAEEHAKSVAHKLAKEAAARMTTATRPDQLLDKFANQKVAERKDTLLKCFRIILYLARKGYPHDMYGTLRELCARNGVDDLDVIYGNLCDPDADYSSRTFVGEVLQALADVLRKRLDAELATSPSFAVTNDETGGADRAAHSSTYLRYIFKGAVKEVFACMVNLTFQDSDKCRDYATRLGQQVPPFKMKGGCNTARSMLEALLKRYPSLRGRLEDVKSVAMDGTGSNMSNHTGVKHWLNLECGGETELIVSHCLAHQLSLVVKHAWKNVKFLNKYYQPIMLRLWM